MHEKKLNNKKLPVICIATIEYCVSNPKSVLSPVTRSIIITHWTWCWQSHWAVTEGEQTNMNRVQNMNQDN